MRTAMSASPRSRSSIRLESTSSILTPGLARRNSASSGGNTSAPMISLAVIRTTPVASLAPPDAARIIAPAAAAIASACGAMSRAASVGKQAARRADEQRDAERALEFGDLTPERRLREAQCARRAGQAALAQNGEERPVVAPVRFGHADMYSWCMILGNSRMDADEIISLSGSFRQKPLKGERQCPARPAKSPW